jgi:ligand-binding sensor domain-containing protein
LRGYLVYALLVSSTNEIYAGTYYQGVWKSTDGGSSWVNHNGNLPAGIGILAMDLARPQPGHPLRPVIATDNGGIYYWNGTTWAHPVQNIGNLGWSLRTDPADETVMYAGTPDGLYRSTNGGESWSPIEISSDCRPNIWAIAVVSSTLYIGSDRGLCYRDGTTWQRVSTITSAVRALTPVRDQVLVGTAGQGIWKGGINSWSEVNAGLGPSYPTVYALLYHQLKLWAGTSKGLYGLDWW